MPSYIFYRLSFITEDSYSGALTNPLSLNLYTYCYNNPVIYFDPTGHDVWNRFGEKIGTAPGRDYTDYSQAATNTNGGGAQAKIPWTGGSSTVWYSGPSIIPGIDPLGSWVTGTSAAATSTDAGSSSSSGSGKSISNSNTSRINLSNALAYTLQIGAGGSLGAGVGAQGEAGICISNQGISLYAAGGGMGTTPAGGVGLSATWTNAKDNGDINDLPPGTVPL
ncbi:hypothetical protein [Syntrophomonas curvata]